MSKFSNESNSFSEKDDLTINHRESSRDKEFKEDSSNEDIKSDISNYSLSNTSRTRKTYTIKQKLEFVKKALKNGIKNISRIPLTIDIKDYLWSFIKQSNSLNIAISSTEVIRLAMKLDISLKEHSYEALHKWFYRFMVRNGFSIRKPTHIGQSEKIESKQLVD